MAKHVFLAATAAAALALTAFTNPAAADSFSVSNVAMTVSPADTLTIQNAATIQGGTTINQALGPLSVYVGEITFTGTFASAPSTVVHIPAWCIDLYHTIGLGNQTYSYSTSSITTNNGIPIPIALTTTQINQMAGLIDAGDAFVASHPTNADMSAAYQLAIWKVEYGSTFSSNASGAVLTDFNNLMANLPSGGSAGALVALNGQQGFASAFVTGGLPQPAPEPASLALLGAGLAGLGWARRRRH